MGGLATAVGAGLTYLGGQSASNSLRAGLADSASTLRNYKPLNFTTPGYTGTTNNGTFNLTRSPELNTALTGQSNAFGTAAAGFGNLLTQVQPGYDKLTASQLAENENKRRSAIGNLRENLQRRRVLGSSFAQDAVTRANLAYEQNAQQIEATNFINSLNASADLYSKQATAQANQFGTLLNQFNLESNIATNMTTSMNQISASNSQLLANLYADYAGAQASIGGAVMGAGLSVLGEGIGKL